MRKLRIPFASAAGTLLIAAANVGGMGSISVVNVSASPGAWSSAASLPEPRAGHSAVSLLDGRVLIAGPDHGALLYDPSTGAWTRTGDKSTGANLLTRLNDGRVLAVASGAGIHVTGGNEATTELFDPAVGTWSRTANMSHGRQGHTATLLEDGRVLVVGGMPCDFTGCFLPPPWWYVPAEIFDASTNTWTRTGDPTQFLMGHNATLLNDGRVLVAGCPSEVFVPTTGTWTRTGNMVHCHGGTATLLADGRVLVVGSQDADLYDPVTDEWSATRGPADSRVRHTATRLASGNVLVTGGFVDCPPETLAETPQLNTSEEYDPGTGTWGSRAFLRTGRQSHSATLLADGRVLVAGGVERIYAGNPFAEGCFDFVATETAEIYTPR